MDSRKQLFLQMIANSMNEDEPSFLTCVATQKYVDKIVGIQMDPAKLTVTCKP